MMIQKYAKFQKGLREAIQSVTQRGYAIIAAEPERFAHIAEQPFTTYLPVLARDLQTQAFYDLLSITRQIFESHQETQFVETQELSRFTFWQCLQEANEYVDWKHPLRVARIAVAIGLGMGWPANRLLHLYWGALLHDVGKLFVEELANKLERQGIALPIVFACIRTHATLGGLFMSSVEHLFPLGVLCASQHQESADGSGYPVGLTYPQISKEGIVVNLADFYDATVTRKDWSAENVCREEQDFYEKAGYIDVPELRVFLSVIQQNHAIWYTKHTRIENGELQAL